MHVTGIITQNLTVTFTSSSAFLVGAGSFGQQTQGEGAEAPPASARVAPSEDRVTLSPESAALARPAAPAPADKAEPARGAALLAALDADGDGAITAEEFVGGARELLRQAHGRRHHHGRGDSIEGDGRHHFRFHHGARLTDRLERLFDRVDANGDGRIDQGELANALEGSSRGRLARAERLAGTEPTESAAAPVARTSFAAPSSAGASAAEASPELAGAEPTPEPPLLASVTHVTIVTIAIQQYTTVSGVDPATLSRSIGTTA